jgi:hypothetical protein
MSSCNGTRPPDRELGEGWRSPPLALCVLGDRFQFEALLECAGRSPQPSGPPGEGRVGPLVPSSRAAGWIGSFTSLVLRRRWAAGGLARRARAPSRGGAARIQRPARNLLQDGDLQVRCHVPARKPRRVDAPRPSTWTKCAGRSRKASPLARSRRSGPASPELLVAGGSFPGRPPPGAAWPRPRAGEASARRSRVTLLVLARLVELLSPCASRLRDVDGGGRMRPLEHGTVHHDLGVPRALELLEDHLVPCGKPVSTSRGADSRSGSPGRRTPSARRRRTSAASPWCGRRSRPTSRARSPAARCCRRARAA